ncbi:hypothetical protein CBR_g45249 [Chara braunii]|uniref:DUF659 domain-containing protein n=1 Tax=Chara braunii TaxID=69332 RepID=A0A388K3E5_CHABU|nr:hypothetical protein CBR_g45249 [Chara braunii]|eukprot:GBG64555.1 hypothetical protein CBR_g45249 [Chara braunii]
MRFGTGWLKVRSGVWWGVETSSSVAAYATRCFPVHDRRAVEHFTKTKVHCPRRTTEILWRLQRHGAQLRDSLSQRLATEYADAMEEELAVEDLVGRGTVALADAAATQTQTNGGEDGRGATGPHGGQQDYPARDVADDVRERLRALVGMGDGGDERGARGTHTTSTASTQVALRGRQTTLDPLLGNKVQNDLDRLLTLAMYRGGVPFNWLRLKETQNYWDYIVRLMRPCIVPAPRLLSYEGVRTRMMDIIYHEVAALIAPQKAKWKDTDCTLMTDGATDHRNKPIMNFIATQKSGSILIRTIDMSARDKTGVSLAEIWEGVIRDDIGVENVNAICTDNAEVMKVAASILHDHPDPAITRIPWIPCVAHCLSLLLRDIAAQPWVAEVIKKAHKIIKFMRNK